MANPAADPKLAPLTDELKELAVSLPTSVFPKNLLCALCSELAFDAYKLICCNKILCSGCHAKFRFPTTCPSCDHSPLEADTVTPDKAKRHTLRVWLQKQKKKEEAKAAAQAATPPAEVTPAAPEVQPVGDGVEKPVESVEDTPKAEEGPTEQAAGATEYTGDAEQRAGSASVQPNEDTTSEIKTERRGSTASQNVTQSLEPSGTEDATDDKNDANGANGSTMATNPVMNGMPGQMGFGFPNQAAFNNGMGWNGMPNMMTNGAWNGINPMDYNNMNGMSNGMYGNFGGNMGMGMNDMSAMSMMQYGGGYGNNGWNGMGGGYGNYGGPNQMGGYNQSGAYPEMMNQFPKNNFSNQNQNRFQGNQGGAYPQRNNRNGNQGGYGPGSQNAYGCSGSRSGPPQNVRRFHQRSSPRPSLQVGKSSISATDESVPKQREGQSPDGNANSVPEAKAEGEQANASAEPTDEGKENVEGAPASADPQAVQEGDVAADAGAGGVTNQAGDSVGEAMPDDGLKPIQTVDTDDADMQDYDQSMMGDGRMNQYPDQAQHMNPSFDHMDMNMGYNGYNRVSHGNFREGAYGAATVLAGGHDTIEPVGVGVVGAPTGPRAMREGRPNTGFSSRVKSTPYPPPPKSVAASVHDAVPGSPQRRVRSRSPLRDDSMRVKERSPTRSEIGARAVVDSKEEQGERSRSANRQSQRDDRGRSLTPLIEDGRKDRKQRSSRYDDREQDYDDRYRDEKGSRGDRTRTASLDSKYRSSRRDKEKHRSSHSQRDRSKDSRRRHRSRSPRADGKHGDDAAYVNGEKDSDGSSRRKHRNDDKYSDRSRDKERERDRKDRKDRDRYDDYDRSRDKDKDRKSRRRDREAEDDDRDYEDDKHRSSRRSRKDRERERDTKHDDRERKEKPTLLEKEEDVVGQMMKKRPISPPLNAPTGPSANGFSIKGRSKNAAMPPPPTGPRGFQPPKGPAADRNKDRSTERRKSSVSSLPSGPSEKEKEKEDHYAAERERNARERNSRDRVDKSKSTSSSKPSSLHSRIEKSSRPSLSSKRSRDDFDDERTEGGSVPKGPKAESKTPTGPSNHRDKRRKSGATGDDNIANLFTAGLRKNAKARRGGVRIEGDVEREMEQRDRERR